MVFLHVSTSHLLPRSLSHDTGRRVFIKQKNRTPSYAEMERTSIKRTSIIGEVKSISSARDGVKQVRHYLFLGKPNQALTLLKEIKENLERLKDSSLSNTIEDLYQIVEIMFGLLNKSNKGFAQDEASVLNFDKIKEEIEKVIHDEFTCDKICSELIIKLLLEKNWLEILREAKSAQKFIPKSDADEMAIWVILEAKSAKPAVMLLEEADTCIKNGQSDRALLILRNIEHPKLKEEVTNMMAKVLGVSNSTG